MNTASAIQHLTEYLAANKHITRGCSPRQAGFRVVHHLQDRFDTETENELAEWYALCEWATTTPGPAARKCVAHVLDA